MVDRAGRRSAARSARSVACSRSPSFAWTPCSALSRLPSARVPRARRPMPSGISQERAPPKSDRGLDRSAALGQPVDLPDDHRYSAGGGGLSEPASRRQHTLPPDADQQDPPPFAQRPPPARGSPRWDRRPRRRRSRCTASRRSRSGRPPRETPDSRTGRCRPSRTGTSSRAGSARLPLAPLARRAGRRRPGGLAGAPRAAGAPYSGPAPRPGSAA